MGRKKARQKKSCKTRLRWVKRESGIEELKIKRRLTRKLLQSLAEGSIKRKKWRPTVVAVITTTLGGEKHVLVTTTVKNRCGVEKIIPDLPKGGVHRCEPVYKALARELKEETNFVLGKRRAVPLMVMRVPFEAHNKGRDDFKQGKLWICFHIAIDPRARTVCCSPVRDQGVTAIEWVKLEDAPALWSSPRGQAKIRYMLEQFT